MQTATMSQILRQKAGSLMHEVVTHVVDKQFSTAITKLDTHINVIPDKNERLNSLCNHYLSLPSRNPTKNIGDYPCQ